MSSYGSFKVTELKELVKERGIASTGLKLKQHFIDALEANDAASEAAASEQIAAEDEEALPKASELQDAEANATEGVSTPGLEPADHDTDSETRKRKRESPPASESAESVNKKPRTAISNAVQSPQNDKLEDVQALENDGSESVISDDHEEVAHDNDDNTVIADRHRSSEDVQKAGQSSTPNAEDAQPSTATAHESEENGRTRNESEDHAMTDAAQPAKHPITRALYIRELVRPLQSDSLHQHLISVATAPAAEPDRSVLELFHLDKLRSHALALFNSTTSAARARAALHEQVWPQEPMRKALWADFIPPDKVQEWIDMELSRSDMTRWEVVYREEPDGAVSATLQTAAPTRPSDHRRHSGSALQQRQPSFSGSGEPMPDVHRDLALPRPSSRRRSPPPPAQGSKPQSKSFDSLDSRFRFTLAKPKLYFQPVDPERAQRRMHELRAETSRSWRDSEADPAAYAEGELRRYTFEGDRIVDSGADFGMFGRRLRPGGAAAGFRGGGARGRRGGPGFRREVPPHGW